MVDTDAFIASGLDKLSEGFGIFDDNLQLVSCNRLYRELRSYPVELCQPGIPLEAMIRFNAERGDFGPGPVDQQVAERMEEIADMGQREIEREMADGQVLKIRYQHLEGGGLTVTFEDKTDERQAQAALEASEERYALVSEAADEAIYEWDIANDGFHSSPRMSAILGVITNAEDRRKGNWEDHIHPDDVVRYKQDLSEHLSGHQPRWQCEYRFKNTDGDYRWLADHGTSVRDQNGKAVRMIAAVADITDRVERDAALAASEERLTLVARATSDGLYDWNVVTDALYVSDRLNELFAFDHKDIKSRDWASRVHKDDLPTYVAALRAHFKGETDHLTCEYRITGKDGTYRWVRDHGIGVPGEDGRVLRLVGAVSDINQLKMAQADIDKAEAKLLASLDAISDGFLLVDQDDRVELWNRRYLEIFSDAAGSDVSDIVVKGRPFLEMIREGYERGMFKPHSGGVDAWMSDRRKARTTLTAQFEMQLSNDTWLRFSEGRLPDGGRVSIYADITDLKAREAESEAARARFEDAIEALSSGFALFDATDRMVICNTKYKEYFSELADMVSPGTGFADIVRAGMKRGMFPSSANDPEAWLTSLLKQRETAHGMREQHMDSGLWLQVSDHRTKDGGIVSIYTDVTELKNQEAELRRQAEILEATLENMSQAISMSDENLNTVVFNRRFLEYMDFPAAEFKRGFHMSQAFRFNAERGEYGEGDIDAQIQERVALSARFQPHRFERTRPDGKTLEIVGNPVATGGFVTTYTDITERKKAERDLQEREAELSAALLEFNAVLDAIEYGVVFMGPDLKARIINRAFASLWGISQDFINGSPSMQELIEYNRHSGLYDVAPDDWESWMKGRVDAVHRGAIPLTEMRRADGKVLQFECISLPDGGRMLTYFDITELKQREADLTTARIAAERALEDLQTAQDRLVQAEKMASLGQLTAGIAHEIKNPLNFVNNFAKLSAEMLEELAEVLAGPIASLGVDERDDAEDLLDTVKGNLDKINEHGRRADGIVKNMLLHSRDGPSEMQSSNLNAMAEEALNLAYHGARAENSDFNIDLVKNLADGIGEIECFPQDLMRVFLNLISNGMYAANKHKADADDPQAATNPVISIETREHGNDVQIEVRDNGAGIPADIREKIFTPFFTTKPAGEGTGLGLSLSYDIVVKQHGGTMSVDSEPGKFTAFTVTLPRNLGEAA